MDYAEATGSDAKSYRWLEVPKSTYFIWKRAYRKEGVAGLIAKKPIPKSHPRALPVAVVERIVDLRKTSHLGPRRITWYLARYDGIQTSCSSVYRTLVKHGLSCLPKNVGRRAVHTHRYMDHDRASST